MGCLLMKWLCRTMNNNNNNNNVCFFSCVIIISCVHPRTVHLCHMDISDNKLLLIVNIKFLYSSFEKCYTNKCEVNWIMPFNEPHHVKKKKKNTDYLLFEQHIFTLKSCPKFEAIVKRKRHILCLSHLFVAHCKRW